MPWRIALSSLFEGATGARSSAGKDSMKHSVIGRAMIMRLESARGDVRATTTAACAQLPSPALRQGPTISERIVSRVVAVADAVAILAAGAVAMHWDSSAVDWRLEGLVVL